MRPYLPCLMMCAVAWVGAAGVQAAIPPDRPLLHPLFADHAVVQRDRPVPIWGWTTPGQTVRVSLGEDQATATAGSDGRWQVQMPARPAGGPLVLRVTAGDRQVQAQDVWRGDVWLLAGQSNMEQRAAEVFDKATMATMNDAQIRVLSLPKVPANEPQKLFLARPWQLVNVDATKDMSAVGWQFARCLRSALGVPIGLIDTSWGAQTIDAFIGPELMAQDPVFSRQQAERQQRLAELAKPSGIQALLEAHDPGTAAQWQKPDLDDTGWEKVQLPRWSPFSGVMWVRQHITLPADWANQQVTLAVTGGRELGIETFDTWWLGGKEIGSGEGTFTPRRYTFQVRQTGNQVLVGRIAAAQHGNLNVVGRLQLSGPDGKVISLAGTWLRKAGTTVTSFLPDRYAGPRPSDWQGSCFVWNGLVAPLRPCALTGVVWWQGENDSNLNAALCRQYYEPALAALVRDWRQQFHREDLPFGIIQLQAIGKPDTAPVPVSGGFVGIRLAQMGAAEAAGAGLIPTFDITDGNLHPPQKGCVGARLAAWALATVYHRPDVHWPPPQVTQVTAEGDGLTLQVAPATSLLTRDGRAAGGFVVAAKDGPWVAAEATIVGATITVRAAAVPHPQHLRYACQGHPAAANVVDNFGLPLLPYRWDAPAAR